MRLNIILGVFGVAFQTKDVSLNHYLVVGVDDGTELPATAEAEVFR